MFLGLSRIQHPNTFTLIGPNAGTNQSNGALNIGLAWTKSNYYLFIYLFYKNTISNVIFQLNLHFKIDGIKEYLGDFGTGKLVDYAQLNITSVSTERVEFFITYNLNASLVGVTKIVETYPIHEFLFISL